ncbi:MAG: hypothetical protein R3C60_11605 [Parvularculaceae bacterium]
MRFVAEADGEALTLRACKRLSAPFCDGSHNALSATYEEADASEVAQMAAIPVTPRSGVGVTKSALDGGTPLCARLMRRRWSGAAR